MTRRTGDDATVALGKGARASSRSSGDAAQRDGDQPELATHTLLGGRYHVIDLLGKGGMGEVYLAMDEVLGGKAVALKVVARDVEEAATLDELRREVLLAQRVTHRNVCRIYDLEKLDDRWMIKMEWVAGETLASRVARGPIAIDEALAIARQIAEGLEAAHREGVIHRDLKSSNVMIEESTRRVVVLDFGIAQAASGEAVSDRAGTPAFMAPEQVRGAQLDARSDVFALGCVLYHMLVGEVAFPASTLDTAARVAASPAALPDPRARRADIPPWLARAVMRMLAQNPDERPQDAAAVQRLLAGPRRRRLAIAAALAGGAVTAVAVVAVVKVVTHETPRRTWRPLVQELEPAYDENVDSVAFSPDGTKLAFSSDRERPGRLRGRVRTVRGPGAGKDEVSVTPPDKNALFVTFTHDGTSLLFTDIGDQMSTWRVRIDGSAPAERIGNGYAIDCGGKLLRFEFSSPGCPNCPRFVLRDEAAGPGSGSEREVLRLDSQAFVSTYRCDRAGTRVVWGRAEQGAPFYQPSDLWIADVATGTAKKLTTDRRRNSYPSFAPDGKSIVFASARGGGVTNLWELSLETGRAAQLTFGDGNDLLPDVSPDGSMVAFSVDVTSAPLFAHTGAAQRTRATPARVILIHPQATPDGEEVVASDFGPLEPRIVAIAVGDGSVRALAPGSVATVTTDGKDVVVASGGDKAALSIVPLAGGASRPLGTLDGRVRVMRAGPDRVVHVMLDREQTIEAWRVPLDGTAPSREADAPWCFVHPAPAGRTTLWTRCSADGPIAGVLAAAGATPDPAAPGLRMDGQLFFGGDFDASGSAYFVYQEPRLDRVDVATGAVTTLFEAALFGATVSPDGTTVYSTEAVGRSRRHVITNFADRVRP